MARMENHLIRGVVADPALRFALVEADELCNTGILRHDADPAAAAILAEALAAAALTAVLLDPEEKFSIRWTYDGMLKGVLIEVNADGAVRGLVSNPHVLTTPETDADEILGIVGCTVTVTRSRHGKVMNSGEVKTAFLEPAAALAYFFSSSDQVETEMAVELKWNADPAHPVQAVTAVMLQALPGCDLPAFEVVRNRLTAPEARHWLGAAAVPEEKIRRILDACLDGPKAPELSIHAMPAPEFRCTCNPERMRQALRVLDRDDLEALFRENANPAIKCNFCNTEYHFTRADLD